jgi:hypothetical protein
MGTHMRFLTRSAAIFDAGDEDEALRLATSMRVLFHNTRASTSLLTLMDLTKTPMLSTARGHGDWQDYLAHYVRLDSPTPVVMKPLLDSPLKKVEFDYWWNADPVFVYEDVAYTRKVIVNSLANKDGGAHVDPELEKYYEVLASGTYAIGIMGDLKFDGPEPFPQGVTQYPKNAHLALARQFAHEAMASQLQFGWPTA